MSQRAAKPVVAAHKCESKQVQQHRLRSQKGSLQGTTSTVPCLACTCVPPLPTPSLRYFLHIKQNLTQAHGSLPVAASLLHCTSCHDQSSAPHGHVCSHTTHCQAKCPPAASNIALRALGSRTVHVLSPKSYPSSRCSWAQRHGCKERSSFQ